MESTRFDQITTTLAEGTTRRGALRFLGAATLSLGGLTFLGDDETDARFKLRKKSRKKGKGKKRNRRNRKNRNNDGNNDNNDGNQNDQCDGSQGTCCVDADCRADEICANVNGTRHCFPDPNGGNDDPQPDGTCEVDGDCRANEICANVNGLRHCFCRPELVCGQGCCPVGATCNQATQTCTF